MFLKTEFKNEIKVKMKAVLKGRKEGTRSNLLTGWRWDLECFY